MFGIFSEMAHILGANEHKSHTDMVVHTCNAHTWEAQGQESQVYNETQFQKPNKYDLTMRQSLGVMLAVHQVLWEHRVGAPSLLEQESWKNTLS